MFGLSDHLHVIQHIHHFFMLSMRMSYMLLLRRLKNSLDLSILLTSTRSSYD